MSELAAKSLRSHYTDLRTTIVLKIRSLTIHRHLRRARRAEEGPFTMAFLLAHGRNRDA